MQGCLNKEDKRDGEQPEGNDRLKKDRNTGKENVRDELDGKPLKKCKMSLTMHELNNLR